MIAVVIPFYNEFKRFPKKEFNDFIKKNTDYNFVLVDDGSKDRTPELLLELQDQYRNRIQILTQKNKGKAEAVRAGMLFASNNSNNKKYEYIAFLDADLSAHPENFNLFLTIAKEYDHQFLLLMGSRVKRLGAKIKRKLTRHIIGRIVATIISANILKLPSYDTQCGAKMFKREVVSIIFEKSFITKWLFDVEIILRLITNLPGSEKKIMEIPLMKWEDKGGSNLKYTDAIVVFRELWLIKRRYNR